LIVKYDSVLSGFSERASLLLIFFLYLFAFGICFSFTIKTFFFSLVRLPPISTLFPYTTLFRSLLMVKLHIVLCHNSVLTLFHHLLNLFTKQMKGLTSLIKIMTY